MDHIQISCNTWSMLDTEIQNLDLKFEMFDKVLFYKPWF